MYGNGQVSESVHAFVATLVDRQVERICQKHFIGKSSLLRRSDGKV